MDHLNHGELKYHTLIGTGGIGSGSFFRLAGDHTLGREESRTGRFIDSDDYCKLHIISHYPRVLLGGQFNCVPIGRVGADAVGRRLVEEMSQAGISTRHVHELPGEQTLFSFCYVYPDDSGGNLTVDDSASSRVDAAAIHAAEHEITSAGRRGIVVAAPEVPIEPRAELLQLATRHGLFRVAAFVTEEIGAAMETGMVAACDLLALNRDEAAAVADMDADAPPGSVAERAVDRLRVINPGIMVSITAGAHGSWSWDGVAVQHVAGQAVQVASTAGAGDCHLGTLIACLACGLPLSEAQHLASLAAALSVTSPHTLDKRISRAALLTFARELSADLPDSVWRLLGC
jgi:ribokinase